MFNKSIMLAFCACVMCVLSPYIVYGQVVELREPRSAALGYNPFAGISYVEIAPPSVSETLGTDFDGPASFARIMDCGLDFMGSSVSAVVDGGTLYAMAICSRDAYSLGLRMSDIELKPGAELYLHSADGRESIGAFTFRNNKTSRILRTIQVKSDSVILEMFVPRGISQPTFTVDKVYYGFSDVMGAVVQKSLGKSSKSCSSEVDVNYFSDAEPQLLKHSVVRISFEDDNALLYCTGTIVNNEKQDADPLVLTAAHCISDESQAESALFYFNHEALSPTSKRSRLTQSIEGASILASAPKQPFVNKYGSASAKKYPTMDFTLLRLDSNIPIEYQPYFAGISIHEDGSGAPFSCIHHPNGDLKKLSLCDKTIYEDTYPHEDDACHYNDMIHWHVPFWLHGTTEGGSSGSPLFNSDGFIVGTLSGGYASCLEPENDFFQMTGPCWNTYPEPEHQLKAWIAPSGSMGGVLPYDPYGVATYLPRPVLHSTISQDSSKLVLSWSQSASSNAHSPLLAGYQLYSNDLKIHLSSDVADTVFSVNLGRRTSFSFYVTALYGDLESDISNIVYVNKTAYTVPTAAGDLVPLADDFKVYPNPASDYITIEIPLAMGQCYMDVVDVTGKPVLATCMAPSDDVTIFRQDISSLAPGIYLVYLRNSQHTFCRKIVVR